MQQVTSYSLERVASSQNSTLPVRLAFAGGTDSELKGATYNGFFGSGTSTLTPYCPSGNCSWAPYQTLALCSQCVDVTDLIKQWQSNKEVQSCYSNSYVPYPINISEPCLWTLPNGLALGNESEAGAYANLNMSGTLHPMKLDEVGYAVVNFSLLSIDGEEPSALECSLYWCINTYSATVKDTIFSENLFKSWYNATSALPFVDMSSSEDPNFGNVPLYNITPPTGSAKPQPNVNFSIDETYSASDNQALREELYLVGVNPALGAWLGSLLSSKTTPYSDSEESSDVVELLSRNYEYGQIPTIFSRLAQYLTVEIRKNRVNPSFRVSIWARPRR